MTVIVAGSRLAAVRRAVVEGVAEPIWVASRARDLRNLQTARITRIIVLRDDYLNVPWRDRLPLFNALQHAAFFNNIEIEWVIE